MDSFRIIYVLMSLMTLNFDLATSGESNVASMMRPVFRTFQWRNLNGDVVANGPVHKSDSLEPDDGSENNFNTRAVYWIPTNCDPAVERGYTCAACGEALHCMGGGFALKAVCWGRRPYCKHGVCSSIQGEKCEKIIEDEMNPGAHIANETSTMTVEEAASVSTNL